MPTTISDRLFGETTSVAIKAPVNAVFTANIQLTGLQGGLTEGQRALVAGQSNHIENGIYNVSVSAWIRSADFDGSRDVVNGTLVVLPLSGGNGAFYQVNGTDSIYPGSSPITFSLRDNPNVTYPQTPAELAAGVTPVNDAYKSGHAYRYATNTIPGTTDMTTALNATLLQAYQPGGADPEWPADTLLMSSLTITAPARIRTAGMATVLQQKSGQVSDTHIINIRASDVEIEDFSVVGNISTDSSEFMHAVTVGGTSSISRIKIGSINATNIRGDILYLGGTSTFPLYNVKAGRINGTNIYRNVVSVVGVDDFEMDSLTGTQIGYRHMDIEPNAGSSQAPTGIHIKYYRGPNIQFAGDPTINIGDVQIDHLDLDNSLIANSSPGYTTHPDSAGNIGVIHGNCLNLKIGYLKARGYLERLFNSSANTVKGVVTIDAVDIATSNTTEAVYKALFNIDEKIDLRLKSGVVALTAADRFIVKGNAGPFGLENLRISGGAVATQCTGGRFKGLVIDGSSLASSLFANLIGCQLDTLTFANVGSATLLLNSTDNTFDTLGTATFATVEGSGCARNQVRNSPSLNGIAYAYDRFAGHIATVAMADANQTLTAAQSASLSITTTGSNTAQRNLVVPSIPRIYTIFDNCTTNGIQVIAASGTGVAIAVGKRAMVEFDGTNVVRLTADI